MGMAARRPFRAAPRTRCALSLVLVLELLIRHIVAQGGQVLSFRALNCGAVTSRAMCGRQWVAAPLPCCSAGHLGLSSRIIIGVPSSHASM